MTIKLHVPDNKKYVWLALIYLIAAAAGTWWLLSLSARAGGIWGIPLEAAFAPMLVGVLGLVGVSKCIICLCKPCAHQNRTSSRGRQSYVAFHIKHQLMPGAEWLSRHLSLQAAHRLRVFQSPWLFMIPMFTGGALGFVNSIIIGVSLPGSPPAVTSFLSLSDRTLVLTSFLLVYAECLFGYASHRALQRAGESPADNTTPHSGTAVGSSGVGE